ncbi:hypothetical protein MKW98_007501 [Papaver atlanticum]|uniref:Uncharacterized protein n=1 Tax=Papaver atlanticum TaxID=357466 RepID=A0AAD4SBA3_9MAGN|nr:hypothetical protein MKW98_007501 [Papaver atlanticum]
MEGHRGGPDMRHNKAGQDVVGQAQMKRDELIEEASIAPRTAQDKASQIANQSSQETKDQAAGFLQQSGEQMKNLAQGAADAVKNTLGMNNTSNTNTSNNPSHKM